MTVTFTAHSGGFVIGLDLARTGLIPGQLVDGVLRLRSEDDHDVRGVRVALIGTETYRYDQTTTDAQGHTSTHIETRHEALPPVALASLGPTSFAAGVSVETRFRIPVPGLGPASFDGTEFAIAWVIRVNVDVPGFDPILEAPVTILQPTALLRAGVIDLGEFALYPSASFDANGFSGEIGFDPMPLCVGAPFKGHLTFGTAPATNVQEIRLGVRANARSTVSGGRKETITAWTGQLVGPGQFGGAGTYEFSGTLPDRPLATVEGPHGRSDTSFDVVVAIAWAPDIHLTRDIAICSTTEV